MNRSALSLRSIGSAWDRFFFSPADLSICGLMRIAYSLLLLINLLVLLPDLEKWFGEDGVLSLSASRGIIDEDTWTLFLWLPTSDQVLRVCFGLFFAQTLALLAGYQARFQAACVLLWLVSFQHRNQLIFDGEDTLFRLLCFFLILLPIGETHSVASWWKYRRGDAADRSSRPIWPLRLVQIQMSLIYVSSAWEKLNGSDWRDGTALYYVSRLDDLFGRFPVPASLFESMIWVKAMTWSVIAVEIAVPCGLWFKRTRVAALLLALCFHLAADYAMNLFLFHWIMLVGLLSFVPAGPWRWSGRGLPVEEVLKDRAAESDIEKLDADPVP